MGESVKARAYERRYPGTGCSEAHKEEREDRLRFKEEQTGLRRTSRTRGIVVPALPWLKEEGGS